MIPHQFQVICPTPGTFCVSTVANFAFLVFGGCSTGGVETSNSKKNASTAFAPRIEDRDRATLHFYHAMYLHVELYLVHVDAPAVLPLLEVLPEGRLVVPSDGQVVHHTLHLGRELRPATQLQLA